MSERADDLKAPPSKRAKSVAGSESVGTTAQEPDVVGALVKNPSVLPTWHNLGLTDYNLNDFQQVKYVCLMGTAKRAGEFSARVSALFGLLSSPVTSAERYSVFLTGQILTASHGIGNASISVLLHDLAKLLHFAGATGVTFIRVGTCGGLGLAPGTIVVSTKIVNEYGVSELDVPIRGQSHKRPTIVSPELSQSLADAAMGLKEGEVQVGVGLPGPFRDLNVATGTTMCCNGFFEEQCRRDGAICEVTETEQKEYLQSLYDQGIRNIEMESSALSSFCHYLGIRCAMVSTVLVDRLKGDVVLDSSSTEDAQLLVLRQIKKELGV